MELPEILSNAVESLSRIPGIGNKTALRQVLALCKWNKEDLGHFSNSILNLTKLKRCQICYVYADHDLCHICNNEKRTAEKILCVVETVSDYLAVEKSGNFYGTYHVLGGVLNPLLGIGPEDLNIDSLISRIRESEVREVILAVNPSVEGDATCSYIRQKIPENVMVDRIGFGIPIGSHLEYLDSQTISKALENRRQF